MAMASFHLQLTIFESVSNLAYPFILFDIDSRYIILQPNPSMQLYLTRCRAPKNYQSNTFSFKYTKLENFSSEYYRKQILCNIFKAKWLNQLFYFDNLWFNVGRSTFKCYICILNQVGMQSFCYLWYCAQVKLLASFFSVGTVFTYLLLQTFCLYTICFQTSSRSISFYREASTPLIIACFWLFLLKCILNTHISFKLELVNIAG